MYEMEPELKEQCWAILQRHAPDSVAWNHYDLTRETEIRDIVVWKAFLMQPDVIEWLEEERAILQQYELAKLTSGVSTSRSVGQAQLINSLDKINNQNKTKSKDGPIFIYTYIPLNEAQRAAPNVYEAKEDIFLDQPISTPTIVFGTEDPETVPD